eukprot:TRINITY_DN17502_c0_g2_i2.p2 TRINITY_DN17502_c0_g2~~TRINITY_DN17502_c0_g2_i2.p2  ORF type:complete len:178 (-),score=25.73 TRINITY_DN17502_c0_g2_i2:1549-2082(-)
MKRTNVSSHVPSINLSSRNTFGALTSFRALVILRTLAMYRALSAFRTSITFSSFDVLSNKQLLIWVPLVDVPASDVHDDARDSRGVSVALVSDHHHAIQAAVAKPAQNGSASGVRRNPIAAEDADADLCNVSILRGVERHGPHASETAAQPLDAGDARHDTAQGAAAPLKTIEQATA